MTTTVIVLSSEPIIGPMRLVCVGSIELDCSFSSSLPSFSLPSDGQADANPLSVPAIRFALSPGLARKRLRRCGT